MGWLAMIRERYTTSQRLAILSASNGGLLVTAVINQRRLLQQAGKPTEAADLGLRSR